MESPEPASTVFSAPLTVSALNAMARGLLEAHIPVLWVSGEVSNFTRASSGHCYFVLKDAHAQVRCTLFRHRMQYLDIAPINGDHIEVRAVPTLYEARGEFQLNVEYLRRGGMGKLFEAFERLKKKLDAMGWFKPEHKRALPEFARRIGVVTSPAGAALRDVLTTLRRRMPNLQVVLYPTLVQGNGAAQAIAQAIDAASARAECDVLILCRGGGNIEDLWAFNEEVVAHAIYECTIPVISGVGHETDFTIADFVADVRAPTPTAAAELASADRLDWLRRLDALRVRGQRSVERMLEERMQRIDFLARRLVHPGEKIQAQAQMLAALRERMARARARTIERIQWRLTQALRQWLGARPELKRSGYELARLRSTMEGARSREGHRLRARLEFLEGKLNTLNPRNVLERGYSIVWDAQGHAVLASRALNIGDPLSIQFAHGKARVGVTEKD